MKRPREPLIYSRVRDGGDFRAGRASGRRRVLDVHKATEGRAAAKPLLSAPSLWVTPAEIRNSPSDRDTLARALIAPPAMTRKVSSAGQVLPAQEEALALARQQAAPEVAATLPEEPGARARKDVETGPMRLRVRRQAVQMSVEFPFQ